MCARTPAWRRRSWPTWTGLACAQLRWWTGSLVARTRKGSTTRDRPVPYAPSGLGAIAGAGRGSTNDRGQHECVSLDRRAEERPRQELEHVVVVPRGPFPPGTHTGLG